MLRFSVLVAFSMGKYLITFLNADIARNVRRQEAATAAAVAAVTDEHGIDCMLRNRNTCLPHNRYCVWNIIVSNGNESHTLEERRPLCSSYWLPPF